jgi:hypothetical protein
MIILGLLAYFVGSYGVDHFRDQATTRAEAYVMEHLRDYHSGDFLRALDGYLEETRIQRVGLYGMQFGALILAIWSSSKFGQKPQTAA